MNSHFYLILCYLYYCKVNFMLSVSKIVASLYRYIASCLVTLQYYLCIHTCCEVGTKLAQSVLYMRLYYDTAYAALFLTDKK